MPTRRGRLIVEPLSDWPYPDVPTVTSPFTTRSRDANGRQHGPQRPVPWTTTHDALLREAEHLGATQVVLELDCERGHLYRDGTGIRADARLRSGRVRLSMDTRHGPMRWALARYDSAGLSWQANVRGIVLTLESLRAVERYGAVTDGQQYRGFLAIEAGPSKAAGPAALNLDDPDDARAWLVQAVAGSGDESTGVLLRRARGIVPLGERTELALVERTLTGAGSAADSGGTS